MEIRIQSLGDVGGIKRVQGIGTIALIVIHKKREKNLNLRLEKRSVRKIQNATNHQKIQKAQELQRKLKGPKVRRMRL